MGENSKDIKTIFAEALEKSSTEERAAYVKQACGGNSKLRSRVDALLESHRQAGGFFQQPAIGPAVILEDAPVSEAPGTIIGRYKLLEKIGEGGMAVVYMAEQTEPIRRKVALKIIKLGMDTKSVIARFEAERQALAMMNHPNIAKVFDAGATETGRPYFVMELVTGVCITEYCDKKNLNTKERLALFIQVCNAVQHAHQKGIIHRDIKPTNVMVTQHDGRPIPKVIDFGIAKATNQRLTEKTLFTRYAHIIGTPVYMSPEQTELNDLDIDIRSDIYSLGVLLYELLTGTTPFSEEELRNAGYAEMTRIIREKEPPRPSTRLTQMQIPQSRQIKNQKSKIANDLDWIVMKTLEKDRARRYEAANMLALDIQRHLDHEPVSARPPSRCYRFKKLVRRNKGVFWGVGVIAVVLVLAVVVSTWQAARARRAEREQIRLRQQAQENEISMRRTAYASDMGAAQHALEMSDLGRARRLLDGYRPGPGEVDLRGWEWRYLWQECQSDELVELCRYPNSVYSVSFSQDGRVLAVAGFDLQQFVELWDIADRRRITTLQPSEGNLVVFSPRGDLLATNTAGNQIRLLRTGTWDLVEQLTVPGRVRVIKFSPDGTRLACLSYPNELTVWTVDQWKMIYQMPGVKLVGAHIGMLDFSPDGMALAIGDGDHHLRVVDLTTQSTRFDIPKAHPEPLTFVVWSPNGSLIASGSGFTGGAIRLWDATSGKPLGVLEGHTGWICELIFSRDGSHLYSSSADQTIRIWDIVQRRCLTTLRGNTDEVYGLALSSDGTTLASACRDGTVKLWEVPPYPKIKLPDVATQREVSQEARQKQPNPSDSDLPSKTPIGQRYGRPLRQVNFTLDGIFGTQSPDPGTDAYSVPWPAFSPDSRLLAVPRDGAISLYDLETFEEKQRIPGHGTDGILRIAFSPYGALLAIGSENGAVHVWSCEQQQLLCELNGHYEPVRFLHFRADGRRLLSIDKKRTAIWRDTLTWQVVGTFTMEYSGQLTGITPDGRLLVVRSGNTLYWVNGENGELLETTKTSHRHGIVGITVSEDGSRAASVGEDGTVAIWDTSSFKLITAYRGHMLGAHGVTFSPDGQRLATSSSGNVDVVKLWDLSTYRQLVTLPGEGFVFSFLAFSPDGKWLAARSMENRLHLWCAPSWTQIEAEEKRSESEPSP